MAESTITRKRGRPPGGRAFDYDEARRMRAEGLTFSAIAGTFGVTSKAVRHACAVPRTIQLEGPPCPISDRRWRVLESWIERRHGHAGGYSGEQVRPRTMIPRARR